MSLAPPSLAALSWNTKDGRIRNRNWTGFAWLSEMFFTLPARSAVVSGSWCSLVSAGPVVQDTLEQLTVKKRIPCFHVTRMSASPCPKCLVSVHATLFPSFQAFGYFLYSYQVPVPASCSARLFCFYHLDSLKEDKLRAAYRVIIYCIRLLQV